jgi:hypothetical protein
MKNQNLPINTISVRARFDAPGFIEDFDEGPFAMRDPLWISVDADRLPILTERLQMDGASENEALAAVRDLKRFLYLASLRARDGSQPMSPPLPIDETWHEAILCTKEYTEFCERHFGQYLHHSPFTRSEKSDIGTSGLLARSEASIAFAAEAFVGN